MQLCECEVCVFQLTFVPLCLFVCKSVFGVSGSRDAPSKSSPRQGVIHDFITQALHKALSNTPPFSLDPSMLLSHAPFLFSCLSCSFLHTAFSLPFLLFYNSLVLNDFPLTLPSLIGGLTPLLHLSPPAFLSVQLHSPSFFVLLSTPVPNFFFFFFFLPFHLRPSSLSVSLSVK